MSTISSYHQTLKIHGKVQLKSDIIFLSDIRLGKRSDERCISLLSKMFLTNPYGSYDFYYNSTMSNRGVGILIKKNLNVSVLAEAGTTVRTFLRYGSGYKVVNWSFAASTGPISYVQNFLRTWIISLVTQNYTQLLLGGIGTVLPPVIP